MPLSQTLTTQDIKVAADDIARAQTTRRWTLAFPEPVETRFDADTGLRRGRMLRSVMLQTLLVYNSFLAVDFLLVPDGFPLSLVIHLALVTPWIIAVREMLSGPLSPLMRNLLVTSVPASIILGLLAVFAVSRDPLASHYQYLVGLVLIYTNAGLRPAFPFALGLSVAAVLAHLAACLLHPGMAPAAIATASFGLVVSVWVSLTVNFHIERYMRRSYLRRLRDSLAAERLQQTADHLQRMSLVDPLTGLANRRGIEARTAAMFAAASRQEGAFAVLMIDVDHFKGYNDRYGHPQGDECLARAGIAIRETTREGLDIAGRYGGEEFIVIMPASDLPAGQQLAQRIRRRIEDLAMVHERSPDGIVTISVGVGTGRLEEPDSFRVAVAAADTALYEAKSAGRNCVRPRLQRRPSAMPPARVA